MNTRKKKILFIVSNLKVGGGAEKSVSLLAKGLSEQYDVSILTFYDFKEEYPVTVKRHSFGYEYDSSSIGKFWRFFIVFPLLLRKFLLRNKFDLVVSNAEDANVVSLVCRKFFFSFRLWTVIRNDIMDKGNAYYRFRGLQKWADKNIVLTNEFRAKFGRGVVLPNALEVDEVQSLKDEEVKERELFSKKTILAVGRLSSQKNYEFLLNVFSGLEDEFNLLIIGDGPLRESLKKKAPKGVYFLGLKKNVYAYMNKCDVFVLPSLYEGMPRVLMEALACGCRCVVNDFQTGARDLLEVPLSHNVRGFHKSEFGYLVEFNNKKAFKEAIVEISNTKRILPDTRFSLDVITKRWVREIERRS